MQASWIEVVAIGTTVGLAFFFVPLAVEFARMMRFMRYVNFDLIRFGQLLEAGGDRALVLPFTQKLTEKGVLLSWNTQRALREVRAICDQQGWPYEPADFETLIASLEIYRDTVSVFADRIGVLAWHPGDGFEGPMPPFVLERFRDIEDDWREFRRYSDFLRGFVQRKNGDPTESV